MKILIIFAISFIALLNDCQAEMLQVSSDGTVLLSTNSIEVKQNTEGKYVTGMIYVTEDGKKKFSPFTTTCSEDGGYIAFQKPDKTFTKPHKWSFKGNLTFDSIAGTACKVAKLAK